ncbi:MAG TPA: ABC transporter permease [Vicinamibacterales bacterium]|nr:ABC transporter permease [Vicinamibacterales bacterium]
MLERLFRVLLRLSPSGFRDRFGDELILTARDVDAERPRRAARTVRALADALALPLSVRSDLRASRPGGGPVRGLAHDVRHARRVLAGAPWFSCTVIGVLALALTLATTVFAVVDGVLFKPLGLPGEDRLVSIAPGHEGLATRGFGETTSVADLAHWRAAAPEIAFTGLSAQPWGGYGAGINDSAAGGARVLSDFFDVIGVQPLIGGFTPADFEEPARFEPVVITWDVWQRRFGGAPAVLGHEVVLDRHRQAGYRIVGVMPRGFVVPSTRVDVQFLAPLVSTAAARADLRRRTVYEVVARLPEGLEVAAVETRLAAGLSAAAAAFPDRGAKPAEWSEAAWRRQGPFDRVTVMPLASRVGAESRPLFRAVFVAALLIVAIAAVNVSGLLAARMLDRGREIAIRRALGAGPFTLARLVGLESTLLVGGGLAVGLLLTPILLAIGQSLLPEGITYLKPPTIDLRVVLFGVTSGIVIAIAASVWPLVRALGGTPGGAPGAVRASMPAGALGRRLVIAIQVAGAFVLVTSGSLLVGSILSVYAHDRPINTRGVLVIESFVQGPGATMEKSPERAARVEQLIERLRTVPGAVRVAVTSAQVLRGGNWMSWFTPPEGAPTPRIDVDRQAVTAGYYDIIRPELVAGRLPTAAEQASGAPVVVVSESLARAYWPGGQAVGRTLTEYGGQDPYEVVGIVRDVRWFAWDRDVASIYGPYARLAREPMVSLLIQAEREPARVLAAALAALEQADPLVVPTRAVTLDQMFVDSVRPRRFQAWLFGSFATAGLVVCGAGVFGLLAMTAARRTREMGIRQALGSTPRGLVRLLVTQELVPVVLGLVAGGLLAAWTVQSLDAFLYGVTPGDARVWTASAAMLLATAGLGALVPAVRASRTDPVQALRAD